MQPRAARRKKGLVHTILSPFKGSAYPSTPDGALLGTTALILALGLLMFTSATSVISFDLTGSSYSFLWQQLTHGVIPGLILFFITIRIDYRMYAKYLPLLLIAIVVLLLLVFIPGLGFVQNGVRSWIHLPGFTLQTSEVAKLAFILWLAGWLTRRQRTVTDIWTTTVPFLVIVGIICGLMMLQPDMGGTMIFVAVAFWMFIASGAGLTQIAVIAVAGIVAGIAMVATAPYRLMRLLTFWNPTADIQGAGYQVYQGLIAIGSGGFWGVGIGESRQKFAYIPEIASDSIFAIIGEEWGFVVSSILVVLFAFLFIRGMAIARKAEDTYGRLVAIGISVMIAIQVLINIGAMLGLLPLTGVPLPYVSLGGSNMVVLLASTGILANISMVSSRKKHG